MGINSYAYRKAAMKVKAATNVANLKDSCGNHANRKSTITGAYVKLNDKPRIARQSKAPITLPSLSCLCQDIA